MEEFVALLNSTFRATGEDPTAQIQAATGQLMEALQVSYNYPVFFQISTDVRYQTATRAAAINALIQAIHHYWNEDFFPHEVVISSLPEFLNQIQKDVIKTAYSLLSCVVKNTYVSGDLPNGIETAISLYDSNITSGLLYSKALCNASKNYVQSKTDIFMDTTANLIPKMTEVVAQTDSFYDLSLCYAAAADTIRIATHPFNENQALFQQWIQRALQIKEVQESADYIAFVTKVIKFMSNLLYRSDIIELPAEAAYEFFDCVAELVLYQNPPKMQSALAELVSHMLWNVHTWNLISQQMDIALQYILLPFFTLDVEEIEMASSEDSQANFIASVMTDPTNSSDPRSFLAGKLELCCKIESKESIICSSMHSITYAAIELYASEGEHSIQSLAGLFSIFMMFASVGKKMVKLMPEETIELVGGFQSLLSDPEILPRAGALFAISSLDTTLPVALISDIIELLSDESLVVRYYALLAFNTAIHNLDDSEDSEEVRSEVASRASEFLSVYIEFAGEFSDVEFLIAFRFFCHKFCTFFASDGAEFADGMISLFVQYHDPRSPDRASAVISALCEVMKTLAPGDGGADLIVHILTRVCELLPTILARSLLELAATAFAVSPSIADTHWEAVTHIFEAVVGGTESTEPFQYSDELVLCLKNIVIKDKDSAAEHVELLGQIFGSLVEASEDPSVLRGALSLGATLVRVLGQSFPSELAQPLLELSSAAADSPGCEPYRSMVATAFLSSNFEAAQEYGIDLGEWAESASYIELLLFLSSCASSIDAETTVGICERALVGIVTSDNFTSLGGEEYMEVSAPLAVPIEELQSFDDASLMRSFAATISALPEGSRAELGQAAVDAWTADQGEEFSWYEGVPPEQIPIKVTEVYLNMLQSRANMNKE